MAERTMTAGAAVVPDVRKDGRDIGFAIAIVFILTVLFLPIPPLLIDLGLALSIAFAVLILMVALWIEKPLDFSAFPTVLLIATMLRLSLNIATTRTILTDGSDGVTAAGNVIAGFSTFVVGGDFVIGIIVFAILVTVNFVVITKGATRIAEVGARFTLDAIPGKQMAIDADLSAGLIDDKTAQARRRELEDESSFFGSMDGASKFVRGDAVAGLLITAINIFGGIVIGVTRHGMDLGSAADVFVRLSVGDGLVSQIPALIVSLAAGLLVSKGGTRGSAEQAVLTQLGGYPRALGVGAFLMLILAITPGMPGLPFALLALMMAAVGWLIPRQRAERARIAEAETQAEAEQAALEAKESVREQLRTAEIELALGQQLAASMMREHGELANRVAKMRRKFAREYGFVVPEIRLTDDLEAPPKGYRIRIHGSLIAQHDVRIGDLLVLLGDADLADVPQEETQEPAFGIRAAWVGTAFEGELRTRGFECIDNVSLVLTHLSEVIRSNLAQLLSYRDVRLLLDDLGPEYKRLLEDLCPAQISYSGVQAVLKLLLAERVSIRNLAQIVEAIAEVAPHYRRAEPIAEHVRTKIAQQICGSLARNGELKVLRLGNRWDLAFHEALKRDQRGEVVELDISPQMIEEFGAQVSAAVRKRMDEGHDFVLVAAPDARPYVRMIVERLFPMLPVLSHVEISRGVEITALGAVS